MERSDAWLRAQYKPTQSVGRGGARAAAAGLHAHCAYTVELTVIGLESSAATAVMVTAAGSHWSDAGAPPHRGGGSGVYASRRSEVANFLRSGAGGDGGGAACHVLSYVRRIGGARGSRLGQFNQPAFVTMLPGGDVCIADTANRRVQIVGAPEPSPSAPIDVKRVFGARQLSRGFLSQRDRVQLGLGVACDRDGGVLYAVDTSAEGEARVRRLSLGTADLESKACTDVPLAAPEGLALSADGKLLAVSDSARHHVLLFDAPSLRHLRTFGRRGAAKGQLRAPDGVAIHDGSVYVADTYNHRISVFWADGGVGALRDPLLRSALAPGGFERTIGMHGSDGGLFEFPRGVAVAHGWLLVAEPKRVQLLTLQGAPLQTLEVSGACAMRGITADGWRAYAADFEAHTVHVLKIDALAYTAPAAPSKRPSRETWVDSLGAAAEGLGAAAAGTDPSREAAVRLRAFMADRVIAFHGAGETGLADITQTWSIRHSDPLVHDANLEALRGVAAILNEYPTLRCEVHGTTGAASSVPASLAVHLGLDPDRDVRAAMECLARFRAQACVDALVSHGVPESRLYATASGMAGAVGVEFLPHGGGGAAAEGSCEAFLHSQKAASSSSPARTAAAGLFGEAGGGSAAQFLQQLDVSNDASHDAVGEGARGHAADLLQHLSLTRGEGAARGAGTGTGAGPGPGPGGGGGGGGTASGFLQSLGGAAADADAMPTCSADDFLKVL